MRTEYIMFEVDTNELIDTLNEYGKGGWTLASVFPTHSKYIYNKQLTVILERAIPEEVPEREPMRMRNYG